jgi:flagellar biosynthesis/type III secretory pathway protein FliH
VAEQDEETRKMYQSDFRHIADYLACKGDKEKLQKFRKDETRIVKHPEEFLDMMDAFAGTTTYKAVKKTLEEKKGEEQKMCVLYDMVFGEGKEAGFSEGEKSGFSKGKELGLSEGKELGLSEGKETEAIANARMFFRNGASMELVSASITTISKEKLEEIYREEHKDY